MHTLISLLISPPEDKIQHIGTGFIAFAVSYNATKDKKVSVGISASVGVLKEVWDKVSKKGNPEISDIVYTAFGGIIGYWVVGR